MPLTRARKESCSTTTSEGLAPSAARLPARLPGASRSRRSTELREQVRAERRRVHGGEEHASRCAPSTARRSPQLKEHFTGPTAVAYSGKDPVALAKVLTDFAKDVPAIAVQGRRWSTAGDRRRPDQGDRRRCPAARS